MKQYSLAELTKGLDVEISGDAACLIDGVATIQDASEGKITFLNNPLYRKHLASTRASAVIVSPNEAMACPVNTIVCKNPYYIYAKVAEFFARKNNGAQGVHPAAVLGEQCEIADSASIAANVVIGDRVKIAAGVTIGAGTTIGDDVVIGEDSCIDPGVTIYHQVKLGKRVRLMSGVVLGGDGFGFANEAGRWYKVPQLGGVVLGDDVDVGANTTIDRGAIGDTVIESGAKLDNLIQVGHNVKIGTNTIIAGCVAIAGSTVIGKNCMIGGRSAFAGHLEVVDGVMMTGGTDVTKSITEPGLYSSGIVGAVPNIEFRKNNARFNRLENLQQRVKKCETQLKETIERSEA